MPGPRAGVRFLLVPLVTLALVWPVSRASHGVAGESQDMDTALRLAAMLQAARSVIASHQDLINDPDTGDKGLTGEHVVDLASKAFMEAKGSPPLFDGQDSAEARLIAAQLQAIRTVMDENQDMINAEGAGFKGFVPAVFARLVNEAFAGSVGSAARIKVTAPPDLVRNRKSLPDSWETRVISDELMSDRWVKGEVFAASADVDGKPAFRVLVPEYYSDGCLSCHGQPAGEIDVTGYPKEGGGPGDLGGVISITLFR